LDASFFAAGFFAAFLTLLLAGFLADVLAGAFFATFALAAGFLAALRVRGTIL
jgi:hypothetical protein